MEISEPNSLGFTELGEMRRELLRMLRGLEPQRDLNDRSDVCDRIQRLCRDGTIPEPIGDLMHVVRKCRNRAEYQDRIPEGMEACAIRSAWAAIEDWRQRLVRHAA
jgi:hypothetical protein